MAEERLGAAFTIDVTDLKAGLATANKMIRESESEFKAAAAGMDDWSKSEEGLNAKIRSLSSITEVQKTKVSALKSEYQRLIDDGLDPASREAIELRTRINNEEAALKSNEAELQRQREALENLGEEAEDAGESYSKFGDMAKKAGQIAVAAIAAASAAVGALVKASLDSYSEYEQLVGGVDTLFGDSSQKVQDYAANAYKTAGMSANEYMETVTGFSASLLQSLGGDTEKAADIADMALTDMADNANKMGTSMESIQNAYGGFAKQNYTMLDNLKLGYGGTKEEMQRLLDDAQKFSGVKYDISSYADVVEAIHVVQDEIGITGTTAKEASSTIAGSTASMKSAWSNLLTGLADEDADIDGLIESLIESVLTVLQNILPRIKVIITGIIKMVKEILPEIPGIVKDMLPEIIDGAMALLEGLVEILPDIVQLIVDVIPQIVSALLEMLPTLLDAAIEIVVAIINGLTEMLPEIVDAIMEVVPELIDALIDAMPLLNQAAVQFLLAIIEAIPTIIEALVDALPEIISAITSTMIKNIPMLLDAAVQLFMAIVKAIPKVLVELLKSIPAIIKGIYNGLVDGVPDMLEAGKELIKGLWEGIKNMTDWIIEKIKGFSESILGGIKKFFGIKSPSKVMNEVIGKNLALGIGEGFNENIGEVSKDIQNGLDFETNASLKVNANAAGQTGGVATATGGVVINQTNNYSQAHSRYELYKSKQQTAAAVRLALGV